MLEISINNRNFLWMTRGKKWGFRFLSKCSLLSSAVEAVYKTVFLHDESRFGYWKGFVPLDGRKQPYVACRCYDSTIQRDEAGRRIPHEFLLLCSDEESNLLNGLAWESLILEQVRGLYAERYSCCSNEVTDCLIDFKIRLKPEVQPTNSCVTLNVPVSQSDHETPSPQRRFPASYLLLILLICLGIGYVTMHNREQSDSCTHGEDTSMSENGKAGDSVDIAAIGRDTPSAESFTSPNLDSDGSVVLEVGGVEEGSTSSGDMGDQNSFAGSQPEAVDVAGNEHFGETMKEEPVGPTQKLSDTDFLEKAGL